MASLYSIGHGAKPLERFLRELTEEHISVVVDVRTFPRSRFHPQYNERALAASLLARGIRYLWKGGNLGGRGENVRYDETLDELVELVQNESVALMCSESDYRNCHRHRMLEPSLRERGASLIHLPRSQTVLL